MVKYYDIIEILYVESKNKFIYLKLFIYEK